MQPRAARAEVGGTHGGALRIRVQAPPADGRANDAVLRSLADALGVPLRCILLVSGRKGRQKRVRILGDPAALEPALRRLGSPGSEV